MDPMNPESVPSNRRLRLEIALEEMRRGDFDLALLYLREVGGEAALVAEAVLYRDNVPKTARNRADP